MPTNDRVDVLVIGAGASGAAFSWSLARDGFEVMCLEQGGWTNPSKYPSNQWDWELRRQTDCNPDPNFRGLPEDYPVNDKASPIAPLMYNAVGGSTIHWSAHFPRFHPSDFRTKTLDGVGDDWPLAYDDLAPHFELNDRMMGIAGVRGDTASPPKTERQTPPIPLGGVGMAMARGFDKLGWHWWPSDSAILTTAYDGRSACNNCGPCDVGCSRKAKASTDVTYWPRAMALGARVRTRCRVREITVDREGRADGALYYDADGDVQEQKAKAVVLACNGVGTPRLLLNSVSTRFPNGLANSSGLVGKNLMFHPYAMVTGVFDEDFESYKGPMGASLISQEFYETSASRNFVRGYAFQVARGLGPVSTARGGVGGQRLPWGAKHHEAMRERMGRTATIAVIGEDLPEEHNRVSLDGALVDGDGIPAPKVEYALSDNSRNMMEHGVRNASEALRAAGATRITANPLLRAAGWHLMGTARMGDDPSASVVKRSGQAHDVENLYVIDGSVFVTAGAVNPTSTIQAVALHMADDFKANARLMRGG